MTTQSEKEPTHYSFKTYAEYRVFLDKLPDKAHYITLCDKVEGFYEVEVIK